MYQLNDLVRIERNYLCHGFEIGQVVRVSELDKDGEIWRCEDLEGRKSWCIDEDEVVPA